MKPFRMQIIALKVESSEALQLLRELGLGAWQEDRFIAEKPQTIFISEEALSEAKYVKLLHTEDSPSCLHHIGMSGTEQDAQEYKEFFASRGIGIRREQTTHSHTSAQTLGWHDIVFATAELLGFDLEISVRIEK